MASRKEYEMLFQLNAQLNGGFNSTFSNAQQQLASMQREIQALNRTQSDIAAYQKQQSAVESTRQKLETLQQQYDNIQKEIKETEGYSSSLENKLLSKQQQIDKTSMSLQQQTDKLNQMDGALRNAGIDTNNLSKESATLTSKMDELKKKQEEAAEGANNFGENSAAAFGAVQQAIAAAGIAASLKEIYDAYMNCVNLAGDFEETMSTVEALSGANNMEMSQLNALAKELGATTKFTAIESGEAMTYMGMAGWNATQMMSGMDGVLQLAAASGEDLALVSDIVTDNLTAFGLKASDTARFADILAAAATNSNTNVSIMGETFKMSASIAGALGYSVEDVATAVGLMANSGIKGSIAGTALKNTFNGLLEGVTLTADAFGEYEYTAVNADGTMKSFSSTINELRTYFEQMTEAERVNNAMTVAGQRGYNGLLAILNATDEDYASLSQSINECSGAAERMAAIKLDNLNGQLTLMNSAWDALKTTIGEQFNSELRGLYSIGTDLFGLLNSFIQKNPGLTKGVMAFVGVLGAAVAALTAYATITKVVIPLMQLFTASIPGVNVIMGAVTAVAALTGVIVALSNAEKSEEEQLRELTATSREQYEHIQELEAEYKEVCAAMGETSYEAHELKYRLEEATSEFENSKATFEEFKASLQETAEALGEIGDGYNQSMEGIDKEHSSVTALIGRLKELVTADDETAASQAEILAIVQELNSEFPELNLNYQDVINNSQETIESLEKLALAEYNSERSSAAWDAYKKSMGEVQNATANVTKAEKELAAQEKELNALIERENELWEKNERGELVDPNEAIELSDIGLAIFDARNAVDDYTRALDDAKNAQDNAQASADEYLNTFMEASGITADAKEATDELSNTLGSMDVQLQALATDYEAVYTSAYASFSEQFGLFDKAKADMDSTVSAAQTALDSQLNFWQTYADNVDVLKGVSAEDLGVTQDNYNMIMAYAQEGTEEAAGFAQSLVNAVNSGNTEVITKLANTVGEVKAARERAAGEVAAWQIDFDGKMKAIVQTMETSLQDMNMSEEATAAAVSTMNAYAESVSSEGAKAVSNALAIANQVRAELQKASTTITVKVKKVEDSGTGYATGTDYATPGAHWVGENGPELLWFNGGEKVLDAKKSAALMREYSKAAEMQIVSFSPLLTAAMGALHKQEPISAIQGGGASYSISIAPAFSISGGNSEEMEAMIHRCSDMLIGNVMDALDEAGIDAKRGVYA